MPIDSDFPRPEDDEMVIEALKDGRHAEDIYLVTCPWDGVTSYYNQGSHASCRKCGRDLTPQIADAITLSDYWDNAPYPCDEDEPTAQDTERATEAGEALGGL